MRATYDAPTLVGSVAEWYGGGENDLARSAGRVETRLHRIIQDGAAPKFGQLRERLMAEPFR